MSKSIIDTIKPIFYLVSTRVSNLENRKIIHKKERRDRKKKNRQKKKVEWKQLLFHFEELVVTCPDFWFDELNEVELALLVGGGTVVEGTPLLLLPAPPAL